MQTFTHSFRERGETYDPPVSPLLEMSARVSGVDAVVVCTLLPLTTLHIQQSWINPVVASYNQLANAVLF